MKIRFTLGTNTDGESVKLPVIPPSFNENFTDKIEYYTSINGLEHSIYKPAGARNLTFESYFPFTSSDPLATGSSWEEPMFYVNFFQEAERNLQPVRLTITEELSRDLDGSGKYTKGEYFAVERMYIPHLTWTYKAKSYDIWYKLDLKEYCPAGTKGKVSSDDKKYLGNYKKRSTSGGGYTVGNIISVSGIGKKYLTNSKIEELYFGKTKVNFSNDRCKILAKNKDYYCVQSTSGTKRAWINSASATIQLEE